MRDKEPAIVLNDLTKRYGNSSVNALDTVSLIVRRGEVYGFLGPNGAGKSTAIRLLLNFLQPTSGSGSILGYDIARDSLQARAHIGYLAGDFTAYPKMTGADFLAYMNELQPVKNQRYRDELVRRLKAQLDKRLSTLSKGNRQKIGLIQAFMHEPDVLVLDEPTSGLDPLMQEEFFRMVSEAKGRGASVFASSHNLSEVQRMCDRVGFIRNGQLVMENSIADLQREASQEFLVTFTRKPPLAELKKLSGVTVRKVSDTSVMVQIAGELSPLFAVLAKHKVLGFDRQELHLESEFLQYYEGEQQ